MIFVLPARLQKKRVHVGGGTARYREGTFNINGYYDYGPDIDSCMVYVVSNDYSIKSYTDGIVQDSMSLDIKLIQIKLQRMNENYFSQEN